MKSHGHCSGFGKVGRSPTYLTWEKMKERCHNPHHLRYSYYGGRGIKVCVRWNKFSNFLKDMGNRPNGMTLDRKKPDGHYCKRNCRWATVEEQNQRQRRHIEASHVSGVYPNVCGCRIKDGRPCALHGLLEIIPF